jgi:hypothetical protein
VIIRETEDEFYMITQHDHAQLSGVLASHFSKPFFKEDPEYESLIFAIYEHDRSWIPLDDTPIWNDRSGVPFSFRDYPLLPKLLAYTHGLNETEQRNSYAGLLCSLHYSSFFLHNPHPDCIDFYDAETARQHRIRQQIQIADSELINKHFQLLQLCDDLSLFVCLNEPTFNNGLLSARWLSQIDIALTPFPFDNEFKTELRHKRVPKIEIQQHGLEEAYKNVDWADQELVYRNQS